MAEKQKTPEFNYYPLNGDGGYSSSLDQPNTPPTPVDASNIVPGANGTVMNGGTMQSPNFVRGSSGWQLNSDGVIRAVGAILSGTITATGGAIGGWTINATSIYTGTEDFSGYTANAGDLTIYSDGTDASIHAFNWYIDTGGDFHSRGGDITGVSISSIPNSTATDISLLEKTWTMIFSVTDADTIAWGAGTVTLSNGRTFTISAGNTGNMTALTYVYIDPAISSTVLQVTTTAATAMGANTILLGVAQNNTVTANWIPYGPGQMLVDGVQIGALSITAGNIAASTITAGKLSVSQLSAITADMGAITAGSLVVSSTGFIRSGQTAYNTDTGFYIEANGGTPRMSLGVGGSVLGNMTWDGTTLTVNGSQITGQVFYGSGSDGDVTISVDTTLSSNMYYNTLTVNSGKVLSTAGYQIFVKTTLTNNGTIRRVGTTGGNGGNGTASGGSPGVGGGATGTAGAALASGTLAGGIAGVVGGVGGGQGVTGAVGNDGTNIAGSVGVNGVAGGAGGTGTGAGGGASNAGTVTAAVSGTQNIAEAIILRNSLSGSFSQINSSAASGSGAGGGGGYGLNTNPGGGGGGGASGSPGGIVAIYARTLVNSSTGVISSNGGPGGNGGDGYSAETGANPGGGGGGGGGGGSGGVIVLVYRSLSNSGTTQAAGGAKGTGGTGINGAANGSDGTVGASGKIIQLQE